MRDWVALVPQRSSLSRMFSDSVQAMPRPSEGQEGLQVHAMREKEVGSDP